MKFTNQVFSSTEREDINCEAILELERLTNAKVPEEIREILVKYKTLVFKNKTFTREVDEKFKHEITLE